MIAQATARPSDEFQQLILDLVRRSIREVEQTIQQIESLKQPGADPSQTALTVLKRILEEERIKLPPLLFNRWATRLASFAQEEQGRIVYKTPSESYLILGRNSETKEDVILLESERQSGLNIVGVAGAGK